MQTLHPWLGAIGFLIALWGWYAAWEQARAASEAGVSLRKARSELAASIAAGEALGREADVLRNIVAADRTALELLHQNNYDLACQLHGKAAVDRAIRDSRERGTN